MSQIVSLLILALNVNLLTMIIAWIGSTGSLTYHGHLLAEILSHEHDCLFYVTAHKTATMSFLGQKHKFH